MSIFKLVLWSSAAVLLAGCAASTAIVQPASPGRAEVATRFSDAQATDLDAAVAALVARCEALQRSRDIPVACHIDAVDDRARMQLTMANWPAAQRYLATVYSELARPFCSLANQEAARAGIVVSLYEERVVQTVDCLSWPK